MHTKDPVKKTFPSNLISDLSILYILNHPLQFYLNSTTCFQDMKTLKHCPASPHQLLRSFLSDLCYISIINIAYSFQQLQKYQLHTNSYYLPMQDPHSIANNGFLGLQKKCGVSTSRQSEPLLGFMHLIDDVARIKKQHELRKNKLVLNKKNTDTPHDIKPNPIDTLIKATSPRGSHQLGNYQSPKKQSFNKSNLEATHDPQAIQNRLRNQTVTGKFFSEKTIQINPPLSTEFYNTKQRTDCPGSPQLKTIRSRSPRFSEALLSEYNCPMLKSPKNLKSNILSSFEGELQQKTKEDLKETISTLSSCKSVRAVRIDDFQIGRDLGKGKFGKVKLARHKKTGMIFSIKIIRKSTINEQQFVEQLIKQIKIQSFSTHSHIIKLYSVFDDKENVYLLLEFCQGGNLYQYLQKKGKIPENEASFILKSICSAVEELHEHHIIHRDIKPQNIVLCYGMAKICDFGWSTCIKNSMRETLCGTPLYISPELLRGEMYDEKIDQWALGILGYEMMTGRIPFKIHSECDLLQIIQNSIEYPEYLSSQSIDFLQQLLDKDPRNRASLHQLISHPFLNRI